MMIWAGGLFSPIFGVSRNKGLTFISPIAYIRGQVINFPSLQGIPYYQVKWVSTSYKLKLTNEVFSL